MQSNAKIHVGYIIGILIAIIVALITVEWSNIPSIANYLNFALSVASIVLAVLAIIYAFFTNSSFIVTVSKIESAASSVKDETGKLEKAVDCLNTQLEAIPAALLSVEGKVAATHELLRSSAQQPKAEAPQPESAPNEVFVTKVTDYFVSVSSWNGVKVVYLCLIACENQREFDLQEWASGDTVTSFDYTYGYLVAASSAGFFNHTMDGTKVKITMMLRPVAERIREEVPKRIKDAQIPMNLEMTKQIAHLETFIARG